MLSEKVQKRRAVLINALYIALILGIFYLIFKTFFGILVPFIVAFLVAALLHRPVTFISKKTPAGRGIVSTVFVLFILAVVVALLFLLGLGLVGRLKGFVSFITAKLQNLPETAEQLKNWSVGAIGFLPEGVRASATDAITAFFNKIIENGLSGIAQSGVSFNWTSLFSKGAGAIKDTALQIPVTLIGIVVTVIACVFMTIDYDKMMAFIKRQIPARYSQKISDARAVTLTSLKKMAKAYSLIILITTTELTVGFYILKLLKVFDSDYIILIAFIIALIDIVPVLGTGTVLIPWSIYSFITGEIGMGVGILIIYAAITVIRQIIEPKLVAGQAGLSPIVTIMAMYIGTKTIGVLGFFILPFFCIVIKKLNDEGVIHLFKRAEDDLPSEAPEAGGETPPAAVPETVSSEVSE